MAEYSGNDHTARKKRPCLLPFFLLFVLFFIPLLSACSRPSDAIPSSSGQLTSEPDSSRFLVAIEEEPDTVDFQCTSIHYTIAQNVFDRLVEMESGDDDTIRILPSLAESWEISEDRLNYTFHLRDQVFFSNGSALTSSDVAYTLTRLLTHPNSCNQDIARLITGASRLESGETDRLEGVRILDDKTFVITLEQPFEAFLSCLAMPGASVLDAETTEEAGDRFGTDPAFTIGTGPFILETWEEDVGMHLAANPSCWSGAPGCEGLDLRFLSDSESIRRLFEDEELDILDLDELGGTAEYYLHGDIYQDRLYQFEPIGITYVALNESTGRLGDVRIRKALQLALNRQVLLDAIYGGRGHLENGIFPHGLYGHDPDLPQIPYDPEEAVRLLTEAGYPEGFDLSISVSSSSTQAEASLMELVASMWGKIGVNAIVRTLEEDEFMRLRKMGALECYSATWTADYNDPDNFIYTFFGSRANTNFRSLCYPREEIMERVRAARVIPDPEERLREYRELERIIVQEDAAWIPLFSRFRFYVISPRLTGFRCSWNGSVKNEYSAFTLR